MHSLPQILLLGNLGAEFTPGLLISSEIFAQNSW